MSLNIKYLTNGKKSVVVVVNSGVSPTKIDYYDRPEDVPIEIRHYCPKKVKYVGPDSARLSCAQSVLYPNFPTAIVLISIIHMTKTRRVKHEVVVLCND